MNEKLGNIVLNDDSQRNKKRIKRDNSWLKDKNHPVLKKLEEKGGTIYMNQKGEISYRLSHEDSYITTKDYRALSNIFTNFLEIDVDFSYFNKKIKNTEEIDENSLVRIQDLIIVNGEDFNPQSNKEFLKLENGTFVLNTYEQSYFMQLDSNEIDLSNFNIEKSTIFLLILNLVNGCRHRACWILNWIAYFFKGLKKSQVALVLVGIEGTGKGVFVENIIKPLFGERYTKTINDKSLNTKYLGGLVADALFFYLDEISSQRSANDSIRNFLKALITNPTITAEKKYKTLEKETHLYGQVLFSTNEYDAIEIGTTDRRYTVFSTGNKLENTNFLGCGNYDNLAYHIKMELELFAYYLKTYTVNVEMANTALNMPEKNQMIHQYQMKREVKAIKQQKILQPKLTKLQKNIMEFATAIRLRNINLFNSIIDVNKSQLKAEIILDLQQGIFRVENLFLAFKTLYGGRSFGTNSEFLRELQQVDFNLFSIQNMRSYLVEDETKEFILLAPFYGAIYHV